MFDNFTFLNTKNIDLSVELSLPRCLAKGSDKIALSLCWRLHASALVFRVKPQLPPRAWLTLPFLSKTLNLQTMLHFTSHSAHRESSQCLSSFRSGGLLPCLVLRVSTGFSDAGCLRHGCRYGPAHSKTSLVPTPNSCSKTHSCVINSPS